MLKNLHIWHPWSREIPAHLYVGHFRARIFYDGLKNKCFYCKNEGHEKSNCPKLAAATTNGGGASGSAAKQQGSLPLGRPARPVIDSSAPGTSTMTVLKQIHSKPNPVKSNDDSGINNGTPPPPVQVSVDNSTKSSVAESNSEQPGVISEQPSVNSEQPIVNSEQPSANSEVSWTNPRP